MLLLIRYLYNKCIKKCPHDCLKSKSQECVFVEFLLIIQSLLIDNLNT